MYRHITDTLPNQRLDKLKLQVPDNNNKLKEICKETDEDQFHRDNIRIDGLDEYENERLEETEELLIETFSNHVRLENVKIERAHRVGDPKVSTKRTIIEKLASYKDKQNTLNKCNRLK